MQYGKKTFSVTLGGDEFGAGWDRIFGKKADAAAPQPADTTRRMKCSECALEIVVISDDQLADWLSAHRGLSCTGAALLDVSSDR